MIQSIFGSNVELIVDYHNLTLIVTLIYAYDTYLWDGFYAIFVNWLMVALSLFTLVKAYYDIIITHFWNIVYVICVCAKTVCHCVSTVERRDRSTHFFPLFLIRFGSLKS